MSNQAASPFKMGRREGEKKPSFFSIKIMIIIYKQTDPTEYLTSDLSEATVPHVLIEVGLLCNHSQHQPTICEIK